MNLTKEEQLILEGERGETLREAMEILKALGKIYQAKKLVKITSAQISGVSYKNLGKAGVEFLEEFLKEKVEVKVPTTLNPCGMDLEKWKEMGISEKFAQEQLKIIKIFKKIKVKISCSCVPYLIGNLPKFNQHLAWAESSAVIYANSVLGARTNRESGISALCSALIGKTPCYGFHLKEKRKAKFLIKVKAKLKKDSDFAALGYLVGKKIQQGVPYFSGIKNPTRENLKSLGASLASSGGIALYHVEGITPEAKKNNMLKENFRKIEIESLKEGYESLNFSKVEKIDLVTLGCPHLSLQELKEIAQLLKGKKVKIALWIMTSKEIKEKAEKRGMIKEIENSGAKVFSDTCMVVSEIEKLGFKNIAVNSGKAAFYLPNYCKAKVRFGSLRKCIKTAIKGKWN